MQIMGEGGDSAAARKVIADERNALEGFSLHRSHVPMHRGRFVRARDVGACTLAVRLPLQPVVQGAAAERGIGPPTPV